jgi:hypothetical protein
MFRRLSATALSILLLFAAAISSIDELAAPEIFSAAAPQQELSFGGSEDPALPDYPEGISQRLLRKRVSPRALIGERGGNLISLSSFYNPVYFATPYRSSPQDLYQHQTSLRI